MLTLHAMAVKVSVNAADGEEEREHLSHKDQAAERKGVCVCREMAPPDEDDDIHQMKEVTKKNTVQTMLSKAQEDFQGSAFTSPQ